MEKMIHLAVWNFGHTRVRQREEGTEGVTDIFIVHVIHIHATLGNLACIGITTYTLYCM